MLGRARPSIMARPAYATAVGANYDGREVSKFVDNTALCNASSAVNRQLCTDATCWTTGQYGLPSTPHTRTVQYVSKDSAGATWNAFTGWDHSYSPHELNVRRMESRTNELSNQCVNCGAQLNNLGRLDFSTGQLLCSWCYGLNYNTFHASTTSRYDMMSLVNQAVCRKPSGSGGSRRTGLKCVNCGCTTSTLWRRNNDGDTVCNACGLYYKLHGINRPPTMRKDGIQTRKRRPKGPKVCNANGQIDALASSKLHCASQMNDYKLSDTQPCSMMRCHPKKNTVQIIQDISCNTPAQMLTRHEDLTTENSVHNAPELMFMKCSETEFMGHVQLVAKDFDSTSKSKYLEKDSTLYNVSESYSCLSTRSAMSSLDYEVPWYGEGCLPPNATPVVMSNDCHHQRKHFVAQQYPWGDKQEQRRFSH